MNHYDEFPPAQSEATQQFYTSLTAIQNRKERLRKQIQKDNTEINTLWKTLFHKETHPSKGMRISGLMNTGAGVLDGLILGWKLYRKFKGKKK